MFIGKLVHAKPIFDCWLYQSVVSQNTEHCIFFFLIPDDNILWEAQRFRLNQNDWKMKRRSKVLYPFKYYIWLNYFVFYVENPNRTPKANQWELQTLSVTAETFCSFIQLVAPSSWIGMYPYRETNKMTEVMLWWVDVYNGSRFEGYKLCFFI